MEVRKTVQVLATTMNCSDPEQLCKRLNIQTGFIIGNQCDEISNKIIKYNGHEGLVISRNDRGVGSNRNETLKYATSDICLLADDDMIFVDNYSVIVNEVFQRHQEADVIIFNIGEGGAKRRINKRDTKIHFYNYMNYGAVRIGFRKKSISYNAIYFNTNFGGGTQHAAGEDVLFIGECLKKKLNVIAVPELIARLHDIRKSTWFTGYNSKYLFDKGVFLGIANPGLAKVTALYLAIKHPEYREGGRSYLGVFKEICKGIDYIFKREYLYNEIEK